MDELENLRALVGPDADTWGPALLQQLQSDIEMMAAHLLDVYRSGQFHPDENTCGSGEIDVR